EKKPQGGPRPLAERAATQAEIAGAEARLAAAWSLMLDATDETFQGALAGRPSTVGQRRRIRLAATHAAQTAADVAASMFRTAGGAAVYRTSPIQRCFRDTAVAAQHAMVAPRTMETAGRLRMGLDTDTATL
ncbi:MAG: acyl-CoA dehydrogenase family protein, partial [Acidimicrobiaceae bacterium]|nr:acyl-CoA dehydrogenase family protein [Acidimicrobiaceae bacterium]